jgi:hypothetical protein
MNPLALGAVMLALIGPVSAAEPLRYGAQPVHFASWDPRPPRLDAEALAVNPARLEAWRAVGHGYVDLLVAVDLRWHPDGRLEERQTRARLFLTPASIQEAGNLRLSVNAATEHLRVEQAYTLAKDGQARPVEGDTVQVVGDNGDNLFSHDFDVIVPFPALEPGAIAVLAGVAVHDTDDLPIPWSRIYFPRRLAPIERFELTARWHDGLRPVAWHYDEGDSDGPPTLTCLQDGTTLRCAGEGLEPIVSDPDVWYWDVIPALVLGEASDWGALNRRLAAHVDAAMDGGEVLGPLVERLLAGVSDPLDKLDRIHRFVARDIRYVALAESDSGGIVPHPATTTLARGFGDCKDKTVLFLDLARQAGLEATAVVNASERSDPARLALPAMIYFDHMVACVQLPDQDQRCVDLTDPYTDVSAANPGLQGTVRLVIDGRARPPGRFPEERYRWRMEVRNVNTFPGDGRIIEHQETRYPGACGVALRSILAPKSRKERRKWLLDRFHSAVNGEVDPQFVVFGIDDPGQLMTIQNRTEYEGVVEGDRVGAYGEIEPWLRKLVLDFHRNDRHYDYRFPGLSYRGETVFELPEGQSVAYRGASVDFESEFGDLQRRYHVDNARLTVRTQLRIPAALIAVDRLADFTGFLEAVTAESHLWFMGRGGDQVHER